MTGVPVLQDVPLLGQLFRSDKSSTERAELVVLITPYIIENSAEAEGITREFRKRLSFSDNELKRTLTLPEKSRFVQ